MATPSLSQAVWVNTHPNLASRVYAGWPSVFVFPSLHLFLHQRHSRPIHLHIQDGGLTDDDGQVQPDGSVYLALLTLSDIVSNRLRRTLYCLGGYRQARQKLHLLAAIIERHCRSYGRQHAAHTRREFGMFDIQLDICGKLPGVAVRAQIVWPPHLHLVHCGENRLGAERNGLAVNRACQPKIRAVARIVALGAVTNRFAALAERAGNGASTEIAERGQLTEQVCSLGFQRRQESGIKGSLFLSVYIR
jgi:hypothetical protein